jgi:hypothetical protein
MLRCFLGVIGEFVYHLHGWLVGWLWFFDGLISRFVYMWDFLRLPFDDVKIHPGNQKIQEDTATKSKL